MSIGLFLSLLLLTLLRAAPASAQAPQAAARTEADTSVTWLLASYPPASMPVGDKPGNGPADELVKYITARWTGVTHHFLQANAKRIWTKIEAGDHVCYAMAGRTPERQKLAYMTNAFILLPYLLVGRAGFIDSLPKNAHGEVSAAQLFARSDARGLIVSGRTYGAELAPLITGRPIYSGLAETSQGDLGSSILKMLLVDRVDYTIETDFAMYYAMQTNPDMRALRVAPFAESKQLHHAAVACPRNAWGKAAIAKIDSIIGTKEGAAFIRAAQARHTSPQAQALFNKEIDAFFRSRAQRTAEADW